MFTDIEVTCQQWNSTMQKHMATTRLNIFKTTGREFSSQRTATTVEADIFHRIIPTMATWLLKHAHGSGTTGCSRHIIGSRMLIMTAKKSWLISPRYCQQVIRISVYILLMNPLNSEDYRHSCAGLRTWWIFLRKIDMTSYYSAAGSLILMQFGWLMQNNMPITVIWS